MNLIGSVLLVLFLEINLTCQREITIEKDGFLKDGEPFRYVSGSLHYFRVPEIYWRDRMDKMKASGLNALQTYVEWSGHEPEPGTYNFDDNYDLLKFLQIANESGLLVIFRPGPYICAERDNGGLPYWLVRENPNIIFRTMDKTYITAVNKWLVYLLKMIEPMLYKNGGPIISVQIENEYGHQLLCDRAYMAHLRDSVWSVLGRDIILFRTDFPLPFFYECDATEGVMVTSDFQAGADVTAVFKTMRRFDQTGPLVVTEYYPGWMDHWGELHANISVDAICNTLEDILAANASVNFYMFHGGTNFGFTNGANALPHYVTQPTSYDYGAPISEAGDPTPLFFRIRDIVGKYLPLPPGPVPKPSPKFALKEPLEFSYIGSVMSLISNFGSPVTAEYPKSFEELSQDKGFVVYTTTVSFAPENPATLSITTVRDRAYVIVDNKLVGILSRSPDVTSLRISVLKNHNVSLIVENMGRINAGWQNRDPKGLLSNVTLNNQILSKWTMFPLNLSSHNIESLPEDNAKEDVSLPGFFQSTFTLEEGSDPLDTFLNPSGGWIKGVAFLNGFNLGRYWPIKGPQVTLYVPSLYLNSYPTKNILTILELEGTPCTTSIHSEVKCEMRLVDSPKLDGPVT